MQTIHCACEREKDHADPAVLREIAASANRIDMIIAVFAFGVLFGMLIA